MPRKRRPLNRESALRDARLIIIATEDSKATVRYFNDFTIHYQDSRAQIKVLARDDTKSAPEYIIELLDDYRNDYQISGDDELWLVIDVDKWGDEKLSQIATATRQKDIQLAVSNPAIEIWFLLHLTDLSNFSEEQKTALFENRRGSSTRNALEHAIIGIVDRYNKSNLNSDDFLPHVHQAIARAEQLDENPNDRWPQSLGTRVYLLAKSILELNNDRSKLTDFPRKG